MKQKIYAQKRMFKNSGIRIFEELTKTRISLVNKAMEKYGKNRVWTSGGNVLINDGTKIMKIKNEKDIGIAQH